MMQTRGQHFARREGPTLRLPANHAGRDFVVGDLHGEFTFLELALERLGFDSGADRLIATGDLIDRGPESTRVLEFLAKPWFFSVQGNHDQMPLRAALALRHGDAEVRDHWRRSGGTWADHAPAEIVEHIAHALDQLPVMIEIPTPNGMVGICHAEPSIGADWLDLRRRLQSGCEHTRRQLTWSRERMTLLARGGLNQIPHVEWSVRNIDHVLCGHSVVGQWLRIGNLGFLDTGAVFEGGEMTIIDISAPGFRGRSYARMQGLPEWPRKEAA